MAHLVDLRPGALLVARKEKEAQMLPNARLCVYLREDDACGGILVLWPSGTVSGHYPADLDPWFEPA